MTILRKSSITVVSASETREKMALPSSRVEEVSNYFEIPILKSGANKVYEHLSAGERDGRIGGEGRRYR